MKLKFVIPLVVTTLAVVVMIATCLVPIIESSQTSLKEIENNSYERYFSLNTDQKVVLSVSESVPTINDVPLTDIVDTSADARIFVGFDNGCILNTYTASTSTWGGWYLRYYENAFVQSAVDSATFENGTATINGRSGGETTVYTVSYSYLMVPDSDGDFVSYAVSDFANYDVFINGNSTMYFFSNKAGEVISAKGTITDIETNVFFSSSQYRPNGTITANYDVEDSYNLYQITGFSTNPSITLDSNQYVVVPLEYYIMTHEESIYSVLFGIIPMLALIIPIMLIARSIGGRD